MRTAWFSGAGAHTALGGNLAASIDGLGTLREPDRAPLRYADVDAEIPYLLLADMPLDDPEQRLYELLGQVVEEALEAAGWRDGERAGTGVFLGSSSLDVSVSEALFMRELASSGDAVALVNHSSLANLARHVSRRFGLSGPGYTFNTACTASANALMAASDMIGTGRLDRALVVGVELFNVVTATGFQGLELVSPALMRPFDHDRRGLTLGEGCAALLLSAQRPDGASFRLSGGATLCDTHSMSATNPDGSMVATTMKRALSQAGIAPVDIDAVKAHGTASLHNDEAEAAGMRQVFDDVPPVCALKPYTGHTLGACGLNEALLFCGAAQRGFLPGTPGIAGERTADLGISLNQEPRPLSPGFFMLNYFGFGGNNTSLIVCNSPQ